MKRLVRALRGDRFHVDVLSDMLNVMFGSLPAIALSAATLTTVSICGYMRSGDSLFFHVTWLAVFMAASRAAIVLAYHRRRGDAASHATLGWWQALYAAGGTFHSLLMAILVVASIVEGDDYLFAASAAVAIAYVCGLLMFVSVRPAIATVQVLLPTVTGLVVSLGSADPYYNIFGLVWATAIVASLAMMRLQYRVYRELFESRHAIMEQARRDPLTRLYNRAHLLGALDSALEGGAGRLAILFMDLDRFKPVNDELGHGAGDVILGDVARRIEECVGPETVVARFGGDEFVVLFERYPDPTPALAHLLGSNIRTALERPFTVAGGEVSIGASVGIAVAPRDGATAASLLAHADAALYEAKREGRGRVRCGSHGIEAVA